MTDTVPERITPTKPTAACAFLADRPRDGLFFASRGDRAPKATCSIVLGTAGDLCDLSDARRQAATCSASSTPRTQPHARDRRKADLPHHATASTSPAPQPFLKPRPPPACPSRHRPPRACNRVLDVAGAKQPCRPPPPLGLPLLDAAPPQKPEFANGSSP